MWTPEAQGGSTGDAHTDRTPRPALGSWQLRQGMLWAWGLLAKGTWGSLSHMSSTYPAAPHGTFWKETFCYIPSMALQPLPHHPPLQFLGPPASPGPTHVAMGTRNW